MTPRVVTPVPELDRDEDVYLRQFPHLPEAGAEWIGSGFSQPIVKVFGSKVLRYGWFRLGFP